MNDVITLDWNGPYNWHGSDGKCLFERQEAKLPGIYIWTIPYQDSYLTYYVGETKRSFAVRFEEHTKEYIAGIYPTYEPQLFLQGNKTMVWDGMWEKSKRHLMGQFLSKHLLELAPITLEFLGLFQLFLITYDGEKRMLERIESAIAVHLYKQPGIVGSFQDKGIRYKPRSEGEEPINIEFKKPLPILGIPEELIV